MKNRERNRGGILQKNKTNPQKTQNQPKLLPI